MTSRIHYRRFKQYTSYYNTLHKQSKLLVLKNEMTDNNKHVPRRLQKAMILRDLLSSNLIPHSICWGRGGAVAPCASSGGEQSRPAALQKK